MNVAFIPVRGGSKSIPLKNIKLICGKPLVYWTLKAACLCSYIDIVYVSTDSNVIKETVELFLKGNESRIFEKVRVIDRSIESALDTASTEFAMLEFAERYEFDNIALIQATSPMLKPEDLNGGFELFFSDKTDSVLSTVRQYRFIWDKDKDGNVMPNNYDVFKRPRRQDFEGFLMENGAFYITSREALLETQNRISGNIKAYEMSEDSAFEIDEENDWIIVESLMKKNGFENQLQIPEIKMFLTDCDGCLTDSGMYYSEFGDELKKFNTKDGVGFSILREKGIITGIITSENVKLNRRRADKLKLNILEAGCTNKIDTIKRLCKQYNISLDNVVYVGDDINDLEVIKMVGFGCCPADAATIVKEHAKYITYVKGGEGVIREIVELIS